MSRLLLRRQHVRISFCIFPTSFVGTSSVLTVTTAPPARRISTRWLHGERILLTPSQTSPSALHHDRSYSPAATQPRPASGTTALLWARPSRRWPESCAKPAIP